MEGVPNTPAGSALEPDNVNTSSLDEWLARHNLSSIKDKLVALGFHNLSVLADCSRPGEIDELCAELGLKFGWFVRARASSRNFVFRSVVDHRKVVFRQAMEEL